MSFDEKRTLNRWRFNKEISLGDVIVILTIAYTVISVKFQVDNHEKRLSTIEQASLLQESVIHTHDTKIAVIESKITTKQN